MNVTIEEARATVTLTVTASVSSLDLALWLRREIGAERIDPAADVDTLDEELTWFLEDHFAFELLTDETRPKLLAWVKEQARHLLPQLAEEFRRGESLRG